MSAPRFDPAIGLFLGNALESLSPLITGGSGAATGVERTFFYAYPVSKGNIYKLLIDGAPADNGSCRVAISMPAAPVNDAFAARLVVSGAVVHTSANTEGATRQPTEPAHAGGGANASVWWEWTAPAAGLVMMDTAGGAAQARLAVYTGTALNALTAVASNALVFPATFSTVTFTAVAGVKYLIAADSDDHHRGEVALNIVAAAGGARPTMPSPPPPAGRWIRPKTPSARSWPARNRANPRTAGAPPPSRCGGPGHPRPRAMPSSGCRRKARASGRAWRSTKAAPWTASPRCPR